LCCDDSRRPTTCRAFSPRPKKWSTEHGSSTWSRKSEVVRNNPYWQRKLKNLAEEGLLRAYALDCGRQTCAVELGYQFQDTFYDVQKYYNAEFAGLAPGAAMLYRVLQDLFDYRRPRRFTFGFGDADFKRKFGNSSSLDASVLLLRKTLKNRWRQSSHRAFRSTVRRLKSLVRRGNS
jgi:CelD/BcsL family acetyltransferase involved in cellulose biosynthesis